MKKWLLMDWQLFYGRLGGRRRRPERIAFLILLILIPIAASSNALQLGQIYSFLVSLMLGLYFALYYFGKKSTVLAESVCLPTLMTLPVSKKAYVIHQFLPMWGMTALVAAGRVASSLAPSGLAELYMYFLIFPAIAELLVFPAAASVVYSLTRAFPPDGETDREQTARDASLPRLCRLTNRFIPVIRKEPLFFVFVFFFITLIFNRGVIPPLTHALNLFDVLSALSSVFYCRAALRYLETADVWPLRDDGAPSL